MKSTILLLISLLGFVVGTAWLAQEWRLEATTYITTKERDGDILRQQLASEGDKIRSETEAEFHARGLKDAAEVLALTEREGRVMIAESEQERTRLKSIQAIYTAEYIMSPLQGTLDAEHRFLAKALDQNYSKAERDLNKTIYDIILNSRMHVQSEFNEALRYIGAAMADFHDDCDDGSHRVFPVYVPSDLLPKPPR